MRLNKPLTVRIYLLLLLSALGVAMSWYGALALFSPPTSTASLARGAVLFVCGFQAVLLAAAFYLYRVLLLDRDHDSNNPPS